MEQDPAAARRATAKANADYHVAAQARRREQESAKASVLLEQFVRDAAATGLPPAPLVATPSKGRGHYRTGVRGWYLRRDRSLGVDTDGQWYLLVVPASLRDRLRGHDLRPSPPPLQVGEGARDGESLPMARLLELRLEAGPDFP